MLRFVTFAVLFAWMPAPPPPQSAQCAFADGGSATLILEQGGVFVLTVERADGVKDVATRTGHEVEVNGGVASIAAASAMMDELTPQLSASPAAPRACARATYADYFPW